MWYTFVGMKRKFLRKRPTGSERLVINDEINTFIRRVVKDGVRDALGSHATKDAIEQEVRRRYSL